jgi:hypothetical protein
MKTILQLLLYLIVFCLSMAPVFTQDATKHKDYPKLQENIRAYESSKDAAKYDEALKLAEGMLKQTETIYGNNF